MVVFMSQDEPDPTANTEKFRAFVEDDEPANASRSSGSKGMIVALVGLVVVVVAVVAVSLVLTSG